MYLGSGFDGSRSKKKNILAVMTKFLITGFLMVTKPIRDKEVGRRGGSLGREKPVKGMESQACNDTSPLVVVHR